MDHQDESFRLLFLQHPQPMWVIELERLDILEVNLAAIDKYGYSRDEFLRLNLKDIRPPQDIPDLVAVTPDMQTKTVFTRELRHKTKSGQIIEVEIFSHLVTFQGKPARLAVAQDISARKIAERALRESESRYRAILNSQIDLITRYLPDTTLTYVNDAYCAYFNKTRAELLGRSFLMFSTPEQYAAIHALIQKLQADPTPHVQSFYSIAPDGSRRWTQWVDHGITDEQGNLVEIQGVGRDVTDLMEAQAAQQHLINELEARNAEIERFTYMISHDLKSPLITIQGFIGLLEQDIKTGREASIADDLAEISNAAARMHDLLDDLLELSRVGRLVNPAEYLPAQEVIKEALRLVSGQLMTNKVEMEVQNDLPMIYADRKRLVEVFQNLIDNAIKFMGEQPHPHIKIGAKPDTNGVVFFVRDNGIGIKTQYYNKVFDLFERLDHTTKGTGIGLALVKRIIEYHGGRIWVESDGEGRGSTFYFTLKAEGYPTNDS